MANATFNQQLAQLVAAAGGIPLGTDAWSDPAALVARVDAVVVNGGIDIDPSFYGAARQAQTDPPQIERDQFELALTRAALEKGLPVIGVCRGMHILNVIRGGTLIQHLPDVSSLNHYENDRYAVPVHAIETVRGSRVERALGQSPQVNSIHHQAIDRIGEGLEITARARDGTIEAVEDVSGRIVGVQWHPEFLASDFADEHVDLFRIGRSGRR